LWIVAEDKLQHAVADSFAPTTETRLVTCLGRWNTLPYACVTGELYALADSGLAARLFQLQGFAGPPPDLVPEPARQACDFQWTLFKNDLMLGNYAPVDPGTTAPAPASQAGAPATTQQAGATGAAGVAGAAADTRVPAPASAADGCSTVHISGTHRAPFGDLFSLAACILFGLVRRRSPR
jgi:hypothetical protein